MKFGKQIEIQEELNRRPPRRGAWIEISMTSRHVLNSARVAPRAGGRGLKFKIHTLPESLHESPPAQGGVD